MTHVSGSCQSCVLRIICPDKSVLQAGVAAPMGQCLLLTGSQLPNDVAKPTLSQVLCFNSNELGRSLAGIFTGSQVHFRSAEKGEKAVALCILLKLGEIALDVWNIHRLASSSLFLAIKYVGQGDSRPCRHPAGRISVHFKAYW